LITCGIDAGGECLKVVLLSDEKIVSRSVLSYGREPVLSTAKTGLNDAAARAGITRDSIQYVIATGSNRERVSFAHERILEPPCCARGATSLFPSTKTVLDLGCDKFMALRCAGGRVLRIARSDRCAAGTGRYVKVISKLLGVTEEEAGKLSLQSSEPVAIEATCTVFVESEVISLIHQGRLRSDILKGIFVGLARRIYPLVIKVGLEREVTLIGGMARNVGIISALEEQLGFKLLIPEEPITVQALGAAIIANERCEEVSRGTAY
jgi:predicted CoA-substrate-specific enzyme activase